MYIFQELKKFSPCVNQNEGNFDLKLKYTDKYNLELANLMYKALNGYLMYN